jgi:hypothetical protein
MNYEKFESKLAEIVEILETLHNMHQLYLELEVLLDELKELNSESVTDR